MESFILLFRLPNKYLLVSVAINIAPQRFILLLHTDQKEIALKDGGKLVADRQYPLCDGRRKQDDGTIKPAKTTMILNFLITIIEKEGDTRQNQGVCDPLQPSSGKEHERGETYVMVMPLSLSS